MKQPNPHWPNAYILSQPSGWHDIGIRYGAEAHQYLSPAANRERVEVLLKKYTNG